MPLDMRSKRAVFAGCARDCAQYLGFTLENVTNISRLFSESAFVFVENDSRDLTKPLLQAWCKDTRRARVISLDGLSSTCRERTVRLEIARNEYLRVVRTEFRDFDYLFIIDCDEAGTRPISPDTIVRALNFLDNEDRAAAVFGNTTGVYYDMWALRHSSLCPNDIWEDACDCVIETGASDQQAYEKIVSSRFFALNGEAAPLEVESAFGGFGIYKIASVVRNQMNYIGSKRKRVPGYLLQGMQDAIVDAGWQSCEHVSFNGGFRRNGERLFVLPYLTNCASVDLEHARLPPSAWRELLFRPMTSGTFAAPEPAQNTSVAAEKFPDGTTRQ